MYMMIKIILPIILMNIGTAVDHVDEIGFSWLPAGRYSRIRHVDLDAMKKEEAWPVYSSHYNFAERDEGLLNLPESFGDYSRVTIATTLRLSINREWVKNLSENTITSLNRKMSDLCVYQFDYLDDFIGTALAKGEMADTGESYQGRKIYSYERRGGTKSGGLMYGAATEMGEWLAAEGINQVKLMLACGYGSHANILMNDNIDEIMELIEYPGQVWLISMLGEERAVQMEALRRQENNQDVIDYMIEMNKKLHKYSMRATRLDGEQITESYIFVFGDEEYARSMRDALSAGYECQGEMQKKSADYKRSKSVEKIEGNKVIITYVLDEEMMRLENEAEKEWEEMMKQEQEKK